jgi:20S proteasome subunit beta 7
MNSTQEYDLDDGHHVGPKNVHEYLARLMYARRSKHNPLWNSLIVGGVKNGEKFLGYVDLQGTTYYSPCIATGFGAHLAIPLMRNACEGGRGDNLTKEEAKKVLEDCMRVLFYRDCSSFNKVFP